MSAPGSQSRFAHTPAGRTIAYQVLGNGVPVVMMPVSIARTFQAAPEEWARALPSSVQLVTYDHLGSGLSDRDEYDFSPGGLMAELETVLVNAVEGPFILLGQSNTSPTAIEYAAAHPERVQALVLLRPWLRGADRTKTDAYRAFRSPLGEVDWPTAADTLMAVASGLSGVDRQERIAAFCDWVDQDTFLEFLDTTHQHDATSAAARVSVPTFVLGHTTENLVPTALPESVARGIPGANLELFRATSLFTFQERTAAVIASIVESMADERPVAGHLSVQTILFTDLAGSTAMQSRLGDEAAREVLRAHDAAVRQAIGEFNGREVKHTGDGMMTAFGSAADAVNCALTVRRDIATYNDTHEGEELLVRFGLNAGEPIAEDDDLFGLSVTLAARIGDWGEPGQVLCSNVLRELLLGKGFEFTSVGKVELKGLDEPVPLYEVKS